MIPTPAERPLLTVAEVAALMPGDIGEKAVRQAIAAGQIPSVHVGRYVLVPTAALRRLLQIDPSNGEAGPASPTHAFTNEDFGGPRHDQFPTGTTLRALP